MRAQAIHTDIVLLGGGHAHVAVLKRFGMRPVSGVRLTLISRDAMTPYSGMLPGLIAGLYTHAEAHIDLRRLCAFAGARFYHAAAEGLELAAGRVHAAGRPVVPFDLLSIDIGSAPRAAGIDGAEAHTLPVKPVDRFLAGLPALAARAAAAPGFRIVVIGGGAGGVELALSLRHRLRAWGDPQVTVVADTAVPLPTHSPAVQRLAARFMDRANIRFEAGFKVERAEAERLLSADGRGIGFDAAIRVTDAAPETWLGETGLSLDGRGFVRVDDRLRSVSHETVFAAGDVAAIDGHPLPKSGVYAVREGPVLAENLARRVARRPLRHYRPQRLTLALISNGERHALASYGRLAVAGDWVWRWKDWIDRRWMRKYQELPAMEPAPESPPMRCGGCGAKVASAVLQRALAEVRPLAAPGVLVGLDAPDDAAVIEAPPGQALVQSVDHFRPFVDDPYLFAKIAANHCLGDLYAMGARPHSAQLSLTLPYGPEDKTEALLVQLLRGTLAGLGDAGAALVGGHTGEGPELSLGLTVNGFVAPARMLRKVGLRPGDRLILTKPLGTGVVFAADMAARARADWVDAALAAMQRSNRQAAEILQAHGTVACTDVTGFGLAGHLIEMLRASGAGAALDPASVPALPGAAELLAQGIRSTLHPSNETFGVAADESLPPLLFDPQTAGGLLAGVPADRAEACLVALRAAGDTEAAVIGKVVAPDSEVLMHLSRPCRSQFC